MSKNIKNKVEGYIHDNPEQIAKCLCCRMAECINCFVVEKNHNKDRSRERGRKRKGAEG